MWTSDSVGSIFIFLSATLMLSVSKRNTGKSFEEAANILKGLERFGEDLTATAVV